VVIWSYMAPYSLIMVTSWAPMLNFRKVLIIPPRIKIVLRALSPQHPPSSSAIAPVRHTVCKQIFTKGGGIPDTADRHAGLRGAE
jgi:hypothetical protein